MPNLNAVVSNIIRFEPPLDRAPAEMLQTENGLSVELEDGRRVRLDSANPHSTGFTQILDGLSKQRLPVYLEVDPKTLFITRLLIPHVTRIVGLRQIDEGVLGVELEVSHARHVLRHSQKDFTELEKLVQEGLRTEKPAIITEDDSHNIIDIRFFMPPPDGPDVPLPPFPPVEPPIERWPPNWLKNLIDRIWFWQWWPWWWFRCISMTKAQQVFDSMNSRSCAPLTVPVPCIPFLFPDDGCWARAHEMCRLMIGMGLSPRKVWIRGSLYVSTKNNPNCHVWWGWHVAPTLCVRGPGFFQTQRMVIDPSLFTTPVSNATWKGVQGDSNATLTDSDSSQFWPSGGTDPTYSDTNYYLAIYRLQLQNRAIQQGPPPYSNCP
jgi:Glutaminase